MYDIVDFYKRNKPLTAAPEETPPIQPVAPQQVDKLAPNSYFGAEYQNAPVSDRLVKFQSWMDNHADRYLTKEQKKAFEVSSKLKKDNPFKLSDADFAWYEGSRDDSGLVGGVADVGLSLAQTALGTVKTISSAVPNAFAITPAGIADKITGGKVSQSLDSSSKTAYETLTGWTESLENKKTGFSKVKESRQKIGEDKADKEAEDRLDKNPDDFFASVGLTQAQLGNVVDRFTTQPLETTAEVIGSGGVNRILSTAIVKLGQYIVKSSGKKLSKKGMKILTENLSKFANTTVGLTTGIGTVRSSQYERVKKDAVDRGLSEETAQLLAERASEYSVENAPQLAIGAVVGALAGQFGVLDRAVGTKAIKNKVVDFAADPVTEAFQAGQEQYAGGSASVRMGIIEPNKAALGVGSKAAFEALASVPVSAVGAYSERNKDDTNINKPPPVDPVKTAPKGTDKQAFSDAILQAKDEAEKEAAFSKAEDTGLFSDKELADLAAGKAPTRIYGEWVSTDTQAEANARLVNEAQESGKSIEELAKSHAQSYAEKTGNPAVARKFAKNTIRAINGDQAVIRYTEQQALNAGLSEAQARLVAGDRQGLNEENYDAQSTKLREQLDEVYKPSKTTESKVTDAAKSEIGAQTEIKQPTKVTAESPLKFQDAVGQVVDYQGVTGRLQLIDGDYYVTSKEAEPVIIESRLSGVSPANLGVTYPTPKAVRTFEYKETGFTDGKDIVTDENTAEIVEAVGMLNADEKALAVLLATMPSQYQIEGLSQQEADNVWSAAVELAVQTIQDQNSLPIDMRSPAWKIVDTIFNGEGMEHIQAAVEGRLQEHLNEKLTDTSVAETTEARPANESIEDTTGNQPAEPSASTASSVKKTKLDKERDALIAEMESVLGVDGANALIDAVLGDLAASSNFKTMLDAIKVEFNARKENDGKLQPVLPAATAQLKADDRVGNGQLGQPKQRSSRDTTRDATTAPTSGASANDTSSVRTKPVGNRTVNEPTTITTKTRTYDDVQKEIDSLEDSSVNRDAAKLAALYKERDEIGASELKQFYADITKKLKAEGFADIDIEAIVSAYFIDLEKSDAVTQARVADLPKYIASRPMPTQVRDVAIKLAVSRSVPIDDEADLKSNEVRDAAKAVKVFFEYFNIPYAAFEKSSKQIIGQTNEPTTNNPNSGIVQPNGENNGQQVNATAARRDGEINQGNRGSSTGNAAKESAVTSGDKGGRLYGELGLKAQAVLAKRESNAIKSSAEVFELQKSGALKQIQDKKGHCYGMAAAASLDGLGNMVIGVDGLGEGHAVVMRDGYTYDPTFRQWFSPNVYEQTGFYIKRVLSRNDVQSFIDANNGATPNIQNLGIQPIASPANNPNPNDTPSNSSPVPDGDTVSNTSTQPNTGGKADVAGSAKAVQPTKEADLAPSAKQTAPKAKEPLAEAKKPQQSQSTTNDKPKSNPTAIRTAIEGIFSGMKDAWARISKSTVVVDTAADLPEFAEAIGTNGQAFFAPSEVKGEQGKIYLIADRITKGQEASVWLHEVFHKRGEELLGKENLRKLYDNVQSWKTRKPDNVERQIYEAAHKRARAAAQFKVNRPVIQPPPVNGTREQDREWVQSTAEKLAKYADDLTGKENPVYGRNVEHSGSVAGPSSYFKLGRAEVRVSLHSKGAFNSQFYTPVFDEVTANNVLTAIEEGAKTFAKGKSDGKNVYYSKITNEIATAFDQTTYDAEFLTYAIEEASNLGVTPDASKGTITAAGWLAKVKSLFTAALRKLTGVASDINLSANDLMAIAYGAAKLEYEGKTDGAQGDGVVSTSLTPFDGKETAKTPLGNTKTVTVDGKEYSVFNSDGKPIHGTLEGVRNFVRWFGDSKVTDNGKTMAEGGKPLVVYHGTDKKFNEFSPQKGLRGNVLTGKIRTVQTEVFYFTPDDKYAMSYGETKNSAENYLMPVYLKADYLSTMTSYADVEEYTTDSERQFNDEEKQFWQYLETPEFLKKFKEDWTGATFEAYGGIEYAVFNPTQIKSATGNNGDFSPANPDIRFSKSTQGKSLSKTAIDAIQNNDVEAVLDDVIKTSKTPNIVATAKAIKAYLKGVNIKFAQGLETGILGSIVRGDSIEISLFEASEEVLIHELAHAVTLGTLDADLSTLNDKQRRARGVIEAAYKRALKNDDIKNEYGAQDIAEFTAEFMSNPIFRAKLDLLDKSIVRTIINAVRQLFGLPTIVGTVASLDSVVGWIIAPASSLPMGTQAFKLSDDTSPQRATKKKPTLTTRIAETLADRDLTAKDQHEDAGYKNPSIKEALDSIIRKFVLRDGKAATFYGDLKESVIDKMEKSIKSTAKATGVSANEIKQKVSQYAIAKRAEFLINAQTQDKQDALFDATQNNDNAVTLHKALKDSLPELNKVYASITGQIDRALQNGSETSLTLMKQKMDAVSALVNEIENKMQGLVGKGKMTDSMRQVVKGYRARLEDINTSKTAINVLEGAKSFLNDMIEISIDGKKATERQLKNAKEDLSKWEEAHALDYKLETREEGVYKVVGNDVELPNGMRRETVAEWIADAEALPYFAEVKALHQKTLDAYQEITQYGVDAGVLDKDAAAELKVRDPYYVPFVGDSNSTTDDRMFVSGSRKIIDKMEGATTFNHANDTFTNLVVQSAKMSKYIANQSLAEAVHEAHAQGTNLYKRDNRTPQIKYTVNGKTYGYSGNTDEIRSMLSPNVDKASLAGIIARGVTTTWGQAVTRAVPVFAPINAIKDVGTRMFNLRGRDDLIDKNGKKISVAAARTRYLAYLFKPSLIKQALNETFYEDASGEMLDLKRLGGLNTFTDSLKTENDVEKLFDNVGIKGIPKAALKFLQKIVNNWNNVFEHAVVVAAYASLVDSGMTKEKAAFITKDMMNFGQKGTKTDIARTVYVFFNPSAQDALQLTKTFYNKRTGVNYVAFAEFAAITGLAAFLYMALSGADDEDEFGNKYMDLLTESEMANNMPIPLGNGEYWKMPMPFGAVQSAWMSGVAIARNLKGVTSTGDAMASVAQSLIKSYQLTGEPQVKFTKDPFHWVMSSTLPTLSKPIAYAWSGKRFNGTELNMFLQNDKYRSEQGEFKTQDSYKTAAINLRKSLGIDITPEQIQVVAEGYMIGPMAYALEGIVGNKLTELQTKGRDTEGMFSAMQRAIGVNRVIGQKTEDRYMQVLFGNKYYTDYINLDKEYDKGATNKRETVEEKTNRFLANGASADDAPLIKAGITYGREVNKLKREKKYSELTQRHAQGEDVAAELDSYYKAQIKLQKTFIRSIQ